MPARGAPIGAWAVGSEPDLVTFRHGVASADPLPDGVVLWTRCTTAEPGPVAVDWWLSPTVDPFDAVASGTLETAAESDHTVHVDVDGLDPSTTRGLQLLGAALAARRLSPGN